MRAQSGPSGGSRPKNDAVQVQRQLLVSLVLVVTVLARDVGDVTARAVVVCLLNALRLLELALELLAKSEARLTPSHCLVLLSALLRPALLNVHYGAVLHKKLQCAVREWVQGPRTSPLVYEDDGVAEGEPTLHGAVHNLGLGRQIIDKCLAPSPPLYGLRWIVQFFVVVSLENVAHGVYHGLF